MHTGSGHTYILYTQKMNWYLFWYSNYLLIFSVLSTAFHGSFERFSKGNCLTRELGIKWASASLCCKCEIKKKSISRLWSKEDDRNSWKQQLISKLSLENIFSTFYELSAFLTSLKIGLKHLNLTKKGSKWPHSCHIFMNEAEKVS